MNPNSVAYMSFECSSSCSLSVTGVEWMGNGCDSLENRESVRDECIAAGMTNPNGASVAKVMGEKWNGLSEEEKRFYKEKSFQLSLEVDQQKVMILCWMA